MMGCRFGSHRVMEPAGVLPQPAWRISNDMTIYDNEILLDVIRLNIDSASFHQIIQEVGRDEKRVADRMMAIVGDRGKMHNPSTGSGGMLIGQVVQIGSALENKIDLSIGDRISTLVSLSLTPLSIRSIKRVLLNQEQVEIDGQAILFESGVYAKLPNDMSETLALSILDVAGAPAQTARLAKKGDTIFILGAGGKSGLLCTAMARKMIGREGTIIGLVHSRKSLDTAGELNMCDHLIQGNATDALFIHKQLDRLTHGAMADLVINCVNVPDTEMSSILACRNRGTVYFFSMATSFTKAALGAEGIGYDIDMIIGNGYCHDHAAISLQIVREFPVLQKIFNEKYAI
ncbi:MAG: zinc-binding dehydrogenase [Candidatus Delongbacteria bacterium]|nr:zinc-binding dehydrogenase [Candidatus Delongbacteria bacterium]